MASTAGALPEVLDNAAMLVNPTDVTALATAIEAVLGDATLRDRLISSGRARAAAYSWPRAVEAFSNLYQQLVS